MFAVRNLYIRTSPIRLSRSIAYTRFIRSFSQTQTFNMRALAYFKKQDIHYTEDLPEPKINHPKELIIDVAYCGICGSDLHEYTDGPIFLPKDGHTHPLSNAKLPQAMGHEMTGIVREIGSEVTKVKVGDHVVIEAGCGCKDLPRWPQSKFYGSKPCAACEAGLDNCCEHAGFTGLGVVSGGFAERVVVGEYHTIPLPNDIPLDVGCLVEPLSVVWHALKLANFKANKSALVLGSGPIGLACVLALKAQGASQIVVSEPAKIRRDFAEKLNITVFDPSKHGNNAVEELKKLSKSGNGFDFAFDCSGIKATFETGLQAITYRGSLVNVAIWGKTLDFDPMEVTLLEKHFTGSIGYVAEDFEEVVAAIHKGDIKVDEIRHLITGKTDIKDGWEKGFLELMNHKETNVKILLTPNNHNELD